MREVLDTANAIQSLIDTKQKEIDELEKQIHQLRRTKVMILNEGLDNAKKTHDGVQ